MQLILYCFLTLSCPGDARTNLEIYLKVEISDPLMFNPTNAEATLSKAQGRTFFENHLNPVMLVSIG